MSDRVDALLDAETLALVARLVRGQRVAALGTLRDGAPLVSLALYLPAPDFRAFHLHVSRLAWHTQGLLADARAALAIAEADDGRADPQTLARLSVLGEATPIGHVGVEHAELRARWLERFPDSAINFELPDFAFWRIAVREARLVAGFGRIHNLGEADLARAAAAA